jgi:hypothetical protein
MPESRCTSILVAHSIDDRRQHVDGGGGSVKLAAAVIGHDDRIGAGVCRDLRILNIVDALEDQRTVPALLDPVDRFPVERRVELLSCVQSASDDMSVTPFTWPTMLPKVRFFVPSMPRLSRRGLKARLIRLAIVGFGGADRPFLMSLWRCARIWRSSVSTRPSSLPPWRARSGRRRSRGRASRRAGTRRASCVAFGDFLDGADAHRRQRERDAEFLGGAGGCDLAIGMLHAGHADRERAPPASTRPGRPWCVFTDRLSMLTATRWRSLIRPKASVLSR